MVWLFVLEDEGYCESVVLGYALWPFINGSHGKASVCNAGDLGWEDPPEEGMATHSCILAWKIPMGREA